MHRPYVTINAAMSCDGKLASRTRSKFRFSNEEDSKAIDQIRRDSDAVLVGATTLARDNPRLVLQYDENRQYRLQRGLQGDPAKVTISPSCDLDPACQFLTAGDGKKYVFTTARVIRSYVNSEQSAQTWRAKNPHSKRCSLSSNK